ncbi:hypothetical protein [Bacillus xiapuensis]|uniref:Uncharacterized protein n=1 Tax=Bacillus xiapuensis TaxID=2014075 RepID=A0ABU6N912_9BACI|nr:hypothetical protein [Bacillus xiapuensis]
MIEVIVGWLSIWWGLIAVCILGLILAGLLSFIIVYIATTDLTK